MNPLWFLYYHASKSREKDAPVHLWLWFHWTLSSRPIGGRSPIFSHLLGGRQLHWGPGPPAPTVIPTLIVCMCVCVYVTTLQRCYEIRVLKHSCLYLCYVWIVNDIVWLIRNTSSIYSSTTIALTSLALRPYPNFSSSLVRKLSQQFPVMSQR